MRERAKRENKFPHLRFLLDVFVCYLHPYTKQNNITNEILNAAIDAERTFKCKWPNVNCPDLF